MQREQPCRPVATGRRAAVALAALVLASAVEEAGAARAHVHGVARLDISVEAGKLTVMLDSPLENLLGFEHAPRTDAQRRQAAAMVAKLKAGPALFAIDPTAQCTLGRVELVSAALKLGKAPVAEPGDHADIEGAFEFNCADATRAAYIEIDLFRFPGLQRLEVQVATPRRQFKVDLKRPARRVVLVK